MSRSLFLLWQCAFVTVTLTAAFNIVQAKLILDSDDIQLRTPIVHHASRHGDHPSIACAPTAASPVNITLFSHSCQDPEPLQVIAAVSGECYYIPAWNQSVILTLGDPDNQQYLIEFFNSSNCLNTTWQIYWGDFGTSCFSEDGYIAGVSQLITSGFGYALYGDTMTCEFDQIIDYYGVVPGTCWDSGSSQGAIELYSILTVDPKSGLYNLADFNDSACTQLNFNSLGLLGECFSNWKVFNASIPFDLPFGHAHVHQSQVARAPARLHSRHMKEEKKHSSKRSMVSQSSHNDCHRKTGVVASASDATPAATFYFFEGNECSDFPSVSYDVPSGSCFELVDLTQSVIYTVTDSSTGAYSVKFFAYPQCDNFYLMGAWNSTGSGCFQEADIAVEITPA